MNNLNRGFIPTPPEETDWEFGGLTGIAEEILQPDGQWDAHLPVFELQKNSRFDSFSCVSYARNNVLETILKTKLTLEKFTDEQIFNMYQTGDLKEI